MSLLKKCQRIIIKLYTTNNKSYYYVNPITKKTKWFTEIIQDMGRFYNMSQIDLLVVRIAARHNKPKMNDPRIESYLTNFFITVNTNDRDRSNYPKPSKFRVHIRPTVPSMMEVVNFTLHKAILPKSQYVIDLHNYKVVVEHGPEFGTRYVLELERGNFSAACLVTTLQTKLAQHVDPSFTCTLDPYKATIKCSADVVFRFNIDGAKDCAEPLCLLPLGLRYPNKYEAQLGEDGKWRLETGHVDVSGCQLLMLRLNRFDDRLVGCVPLHDVCAPEAIVYYQNPNSETMCRGWDHGHKVPAFHRFAECTVTDVYGREYNFNEINCTYVFNVVCKAYRIVG